TAEDRSRTGQYLQNQQRETFRANSVSLRKFIDGLDLKVEIEPLLPPQLARAAQLTQRTNQFNLTTRRRNESELHSFLAANTALTVTVSDRFGDYGLVGVLIYELQSDVLEVDTFLLSCRVLGRGVEYRMLASLGELAEQTGRSWVDLHFTKTAKNQPAFDFLQRVGQSFCQPQNGGYVFRF